MDKFTLESGNEAVEQTVKQPENEAKACGHCGALVYSDTPRCPQCGRFPVKLHRCAHCGCISAAEAPSCWKCGRGFEPDGDYL